MQATDLFRRLKDGHPETGMAFSDMTAAANFATDNHTELKHSCYETAA